MAVGSRRSGAKTAYPVVPRPEFSRLLTAPTPIAQRMPRVDSLTGFRWWAAFLVFGLHMQDFAPLTGVSSSILSQGYLGVTFFFVLSGFVLTWSATAQVSQSTFYWRRFARIYPSHIVALLIAIPVFYTFTPAEAPDWVKPISVGVLALSVVHFQGWSLNPRVIFSGNPAAWTLTCEAFFYALHPYVSRFLMSLARRGALIFALATIAIAFAYRVATMMFPALLAIPAPVVHLHGFVLGMAIAWAFRRGWQPRIPVWVGVGAMAAVIVAIADVPGVPPALTWLAVGFGNEFFTIACALAIAGVAQRSIERKSSLFGHRFQGALDEWSFAFYLVHASFIYTALAVFGPQQAGWSNLGWYAVLLAVSLLGAAALHYGVERPLEKRMRAWKDSRIRA